VKELWGVIKRAKPGQLAELMILCLKNIRFVFPTYKATKSAVAFANTHFGLSHRRNTPANAFRHALWNWLIAKACFRIASDKEKVLLWTKKITDMHEKILPGNEVSNAMDLHNNAVGRQAFKTITVPDIDSGVAFFLELTECSQKVNTLEEIMQSPLSQLVHLIDTKL
jgi:hypothetical protein